MGLWNAVESMVLIAISLIVCVCTHPHDDRVILELQHEEHLYEHLLDHYIRVLRPAANHSEDRVVVSSSAHVVALTNQGSIPNTIGARIMLRQVWHDSRLRWNRSDYDGLYTIDLPANKIWLPDLLPLELSNSIENKEDVAIVRNLVTVTYAGDVTWHSLIDILASCSLPLEVDESASGSLFCEAGFLSVSYNNSQMSFASTPLSVTHLNDYEGQFTRAIGTYVISLKRVEVHSTAMDMFYNGCQNTHPGLSVQLTMNIKDEPMSRHQNLGLMISYIMLAFFIPVVYLLPIHSHTRPLLGTILFLSEMTLSLLSLSPAGAQIDTKIALFSRICQLLSVILVISSILLIKLLTTHPHVALPAWLKNMLLGRCGLRRLVCYDVYVRAPVTSHDETVLTSMEDTGSTTTMEDGQKYPYHFGDSGGGVIERGSRGVLAGDEGVMDKPSAGLDRAKQDLYHVVAIINRFMFVVTILTVLICVIAFLRR